MDRATTSAILGTILGLLAGIGGMYFLGNQDRNDTREEDLARLRSGQLAAEAESQKLQRAIDQLNADAQYERKAASDFAAEQERLARQKGEADALANKYKSELDLLKGNSGESTRQREARIADLEALLEKNGILEFLTPEELQKRLETQKQAFENAFATKDKKGVMDALWKAQKLGPVAYDAAIEMWRKAAADFGLDPFGKGPGTLGLTFQEYVSLINDFGMVKKGLTDPNVSADFRISSLYGLPWWSSESAADRAKLADDVLRASKGYETGVAVEALRDIQDPSSIKYLSSFLAGNTDNAAARTGAINALALKNTPEAWNAIELAAQNDPDENVRKTAQRQLSTRESSVEGVMITWVGADSQGALAGIKVGDVLTHYNGVRIKTLEDVNKAKEAVGADQTVTVIVRRGSEDLNLQLGPGMIGINGTAVSPKK